MAAVSSCSVAGVFTLSSGIILFILTASMWAEVSSPNPNLFSCKGFPVNCQVTCCYGDLHMQLGLCMSTTELCFPFGPNLPVHEILNLLGWKLQSDPSYFSASSPVSTRTSPAKLNVSPFRTCMSFYICSFCITCACSQKDPSITSPPGNHLPTSQESALSPLLCLAGVGGVCLTLPA